MNIFINFDRLETLGLVPNARILEDKITGRQKGVEIEVHTAEGARWPVVETIQLNKAVQKEVSDEFMDAQFHRLEREVIKHILFKD